MNWDAVGALAELGGAIGVVVTLITSLVRFAPKTPKVASTR